MSDMSINMSIKEAYKKMQAECGIEAGDTVRVIRDCELKEMGWGGDYIDKDALSNMKGLKARVIAVQSDRININCTKNGSGYRSHLQVPFYCLELVEKAKPELPPIMIGEYEVAFLDNGNIRVCQEVITKATLQEILERFEGHI